MKKLLIVVLAVASVSLTQAQKGLTGDWHACLFVEGIGCSAGMLQRYPKIGPQCQRAEESCSAYQKRVAQR